MTCPACGGALSAGQQSCPACGTIVLLRVEGALAPDPLSITPSVQGKVEPLREIPGLRKRERSWKDEVRERVRHRKQQKSGGELPLFRETEEVETEAAAAPPSSPELPARPASAYTVTEKVGLRELDDQDAADLPLRPLEESALEAQVARVAESAVPRTLLEESAGPEGEWPLDLPSPPSEPRPLERPAFLLERLKAAFVDLALLLGLWTTVVYFASRAARVPILGLRPTWPWLSGYLGFLGLAYAAYFTGTTGQTLGKMMRGLRVVDTVGRPPGYWRAFARAVLGALGILLMGVGLFPVFFDPAHRALHDRVFRTRVVKS